MTEIIEWPRAWWPWVTGQFTLTPRSQRSVSTWTQRQNVYGPHVQLWYAKFSFQNLTNVDATQRETVLERLAGGANLLRIGHPLRCHPQYNRERTAGSTRFSDNTTFSDGTKFIDGLIAPTIHVVAAAVRGDTSCIVGELPASVSRVLRLGDFIEFRRDGVADETPSLHRITRDAPSNSSGETRIEFLPALRKALAAGDQAVLQYTTSVFRLADDNQGAVDYAVNFGAVGFQLIEAIL